MRRIPDVRSVRHVRTSVETCGRVPVRPRDVRVSARGNPTREGTTRLALVKRARLAGRLDRLGSGGTVRGRTIPIGGVVSAHGRSVAVIKVALSEGANCDAWGRDDAVCGTHGMRAHDPGPTAPCVPPRFYLGVRQSDLLTVCGALGPCARGAGRPPRCAPVFLGTREPWHTGCRGDISAGQRRFLAPFQDQMVRTVRSMRRSQPCKMWIFTAKTFPWLATNGSDTPRHAQGTALARALLASRTSG
jgi:hypothetical protein